MAKVRKSPKLMIYKISISYSTYCCSAKWNNELEILLLSLLETLTSVLLWSTSCFN